MFNFRYIYFNFNFIKKFDLLHKLLAHIFFHQLLFYFKSNYPFKSEYLAYQTHPLNCLLYFILPEFCPDLIYLIHFFGFLVM